MATSNFVKGMILPIEGGIPIIFQYNPKTISGPTASAKFAAIECAGREFPYLQYTNGDKSVIRFDLIFATTSDGGALVIANFLALNLLTKPIPRGAGVPRPSRVMYIQGSFLRELCWVVEVNPDFTLGRGGSFVSTSNPDWAKISVTLWRCGT